MNHEPVQDRVTAAIGRRHRGRGRQTSGAITGGRSTGKNRMISSLMLTVLLNVSAVALEVTLVPTESEWDYCVLDPDIRWDFANLPYDWFQWDDAVWATGQTGFGTPNIPAPEGLTVHTDWLAGTDLALRHSFELEWLPGRAQLDLAVDNGAIVWINGHLINYPPRNEEGWTWKWEYTYEIDPAVFILGRNTVSVLAEDHGGRAYFEMQLTGWPPSTYYVDDDALHDPGPYDANLSDPDEDGTREHPFDRIQEGIEAALDGDMVIVLGGTYWEMIDFQGKSIKLTGFDPDITDTEDFHCPVIDPAYGGTAVVLANGESEQTLLEGFTITRGQGELAGGILCRGSHPIIRDCLIVGNRATGQGDDIGGGVACVDSNAVFVNCTISGNCGGRSAVTVTPSSQNVFRNCIVWDNEPSGFSVAGDVFQVTENGYPQIVYCDIDLDWSGEGNLNVDPLFVMPGYWAIPGATEPAETQCDPNNAWTDGDYHLQWASPCINAGDPDYTPGAHEYDCDGESRILDGRLDMGVDEVGLMGCLLTLSSTKGGTVVAPGEGSLEFECGTTILLEALAEECYHFAGWTGSGVEAGAVADANAASTTITLNTDYTLIANFTLDEPTLTISSTTGGSVVTPGEGVFGYECGATVEVEAVAEACYRFSHWTGTAIGPDAPDPCDPKLTLVVDKDYTLEAHFVKLEYVLTITSDERGSVIVPGEGDHVYECGVSVPVEATASEHATFVNWTGTAVEAGKVADPTATETTVTVDGTYTLHANFRMDQYVISFASTEGGDVELWAKYPGYWPTWLNPQTLTFDHGTNLLFEARPKDGYAFSHWSGTIYSTAVYLFFPVDQDHEITANFIPIEVE